MERELIFNDKKTGLVIKNTRKVIGINSAIFIFLGIILMISSIFIIRDFFVQKNLTSLIVGLIFIYLSAGLIINIIKSDDSITIDKIQKVIVWNRFRKVSLPFSEVANISVSFSVKYEPDFGEYSVFDIDICDKKNNLYQVSEVKNESEATEIGQVVASFLEIDLTNHIITKSQPVCNERIV